MSEEVFPKVPAVELETTVRRARQDGAIKMVIDRNADGTFHFVATFPD